MSHRLIPMPRWLLALMPYGMSQRPCRPTTCGSSPRPSLPQSGQIVGVRLRVGQDLLGDPLPRDSALDQSVSSSRMRQGRKPLVGRDGADPAGFLRVAATGLARHRLSQQPERRRTGGRKVQSVSEGRRPGRHRGIESQPQRDRRRRRTKFLPAAPKAWCSRDRPTRRKATGGSVSRSNLWPNGIHTRMRPGEDLPVRLTYENRPLAGALVVAMNRMNPLEKVALAPITTAACGFVWLARDVVDQSRAYDSRARRRQRRMGELLGIAHF